MVSILSLQPDRIVVASAFCGPLKAVEFDVQVQPYRTISFSLAFCGPLKAVDFDVRMLP